MPLKYRLLSITVVVFAGLILLSSIHPPTTSATTPASTGLQESSSIQNLKGLVIDPAFTVYHHSGGPRLETLARTGFTVIGTIAYSEFHDPEWTSLKVWVQSVHATGFVSLVDLTGDQHAFSTEVTMGVRLAAMQVDIISLDEPISMYNLTQPQLHSGMDSILRVNPKQQIMITEYRPDVIEDAYSWTTNYSTVRIATDEYYVKSVIDFGIREASKYGKSPVAWLIFEQGSQDFDCYANLNQWAQYVKDKPVDVFFWYVDRAGTWQAEWHSVAMFRTSLASVDNLQYPEIISLVFLESKQVLFRCVGERL